MPRNNPYDKELTGWRKTVSDIGFVITVVLVLAFIIYFVTRQPSNVRTNFDPVTTPIAFRAESGEFRQFAESVTDVTGMGPDFKESYPTVTRLLNMDGELFTENKPYITDDGDSVALALPYHNTSDETMVLFDLLLLPYSEADGVVTVSAPERYTYTYDVEAGVLSSETVRKERFRLGFYTIRIEYEKARTADFVMTLNSVISDREAKSTGLHLAVSGDNSYSATLKRLDFTSEVTGTLTHTDRVTIAFGDLLYDTFEQITLPAAETGGMRIGFN